MAILTVGSGQQFQTIAAAVGASQDGDTVQIQAGTYTNDFAEITKKITLEGVGGTVSLVATGTIPNGKAILITDTDVTIKNLTFSGATVSDGNGAGIRYQGGNLTIIGSTFRNNQNGLMGGAVAGGTITIQNSEFDHNGAGDGYTHNVYVGDIASLTIDNSYFHGAVVGHEIKSRAEITTITNSRIQDEPGGTASYSIDLPNGGAATITNNVIEQSAASQNPNMIAFGEEGNVHSGSSLTVTNNTILNDLGSGSSMAVWNATSASATITNNSFYGLSPSQILRGTGTVSGNTTLSTEPALDIRPPSAPLTVQPVTPVAVPPVTPSSPASVVPPNPIPLVTDKPTQLTDPGLNAPHDLSGSANNTAAPMSASIDQSTVFRFFDQTHGTQFLTDSVPERNQIIASRPDLTYEGGAFTDASGNPGATSVYRFFNATDGTHFFTASSAERDSVIATRSDLTYEGSAFAEYATPEAGSSAVYRFFDSINGNHFFTSSDTERASILSSRPDMISEGIAFYAPTST